MKLRFDPDEVPARRRWKVADSGERILRHERGDHDGHRRVSGRAPGRRRTRNEHRHAISRELPHDHDAAGPVEVERALLR